MAVAKHAPAPTPGLRSLAVDSILELGRLRDGQPFDKKVLLQFAKALRSASIGGGVRQTYLVDPTYFEPLKRLYDDKHSEPAGSVTDLQRFFTKAAGGIRRAAESPEDMRGQAKDLIQFCVELHRELVAKAEAELGYVDRRTSRDLPRSNLDAA